MIAINRNDEVAREKFSRLKKERLTYRGAIIESLEKFGDAEVADLSKDYELRNTITKELSEYMKENFNAIKENAFSFMAWKDIKNFRNTLHLCIVRKGEKRWHLIIKKSTGNFICSCLYIENEL